MVVLPLQSLQPRRVFRVKKGIVILLLALALIILASPGVVGHLAERTMGRNLEWAASRQGDFEVMSLGFERGWFSSTGQHRIELVDGDLRDTLLLLLEPTEPLPALIIDSRIDHGLLPAGSLMPALGRAVSTLHLDRADGSTFAIPGQVITDVSLAGNLNSRLVLEPGSLQAGSEVAHWGNVDIRVTTNPSGNNVAVQGAVDTLDLANPDASIRFGQITEVRLTAVEFAADVKTTRYGFSTGEVHAAIGSIETPFALMPQMFGPVSLDQATTLHGDRVSLDGVLRLDNISAGQLGPANLAIELAVSGVNAEAFGRISSALQSFGPYMNFDALSALVEEDAKKTLADGFELHLTRFGLEVQQGELEATLHAVVEPSDLDNPVEVVNALTADFDLVVSAGLMDALVAIDPVANATIAAGFLRRNGGVYEMAGTFEDGLLTVNGAPIPVPMPGGN